VQNKHDPVVSDTNRHYAELDLTLPFEEWHETKMEQLTERFMSEHDFSTVLTDYDLDCTRLNLAWKSINRLRHAARPGDNDHLVRMAMVSMMETAAKKWSEAEIERELKAGECLESF
jgi:hypothetical protein